MKRLCHLALWISVLACATSQAATFTVTNVNDSGVGSLRQAILNANGSTAPDTIAFNIPGLGVHTITTTNVLPDITAPVIIDGYTQPGSSPNTLAAGDNAVLLIEISGDNSMDGLTFRSGSTNSLVRGLVLNQFSRVIHFNGASALAGSSVVEGCFIGTTPNGLATKGNNNQVGVLTSNNGIGNRVGGTTPAARNIISCPSGNGVQIDVNSVSNVVQGNFIGVDATGTNAVGGQNNGIFINNGAHNCLIGGTNAAARNIIVSAAGGFGIQCNNSAGHFIQGNFIGTDVTGTKLLGNLGHGINLGNASTATIGGVTATPGGPPGNIIAGGAFSGIALFDNAIVQGNLIGTDVTGTRDFGSGQDGIAFNGAKNCLIGGTNAGARNIISGHNRRGIDFEGGGATNVIQGNFIGSDISGGSPLPNGNSGIYLGGGRDNVIGPANVITFNGGDGITSDSSGINNRITANAIFANGNTGTHLGIDLGTDGVTGNDAGDMDSGPNRLQNFPVLTNVVVSLAGVTFQGFLASAPNISYTVEFFGNTTCDPSGFGEGQTFIGSTNLTTDATGTNFFSVTLTADVVCRFFATATATDPNGNTSEFSACRQTASVDTDGDGACDVEEVLAGTDVNNPASVFRITSITREGDDTHVAWQAGGDRTNMLQATTGTAAGSLTNNFTDLPPEIALPGAGDVFTNRLHLGGATNSARYYRVRLLR
jgi:hypothetical protein